MMMTLVNINISIWSYYVWFVPWCSRSLTFSFLRNFALVNSNQTIKDYSRIKIYHHKYIVTLHVCIEILFKAVTSGKPLLS